MSSREQIDPPPHGVAEKSSKSAKLLRIGISTKTWRTILSIGKRVFEKEGGTPLSPSLGDLERIKVPLDTAR